MKEWLTNVKAPKFLRYLFFIAYSFYRRFITHRSGAHRIAIMLLGMMHMLAYQGIYFYVFLPQKKSSVFVVIALLIIQFYFWFVHKKKWELYIEEFKNTNRKEKIFGGLYLFIYLFICSLPIAIPVYLSLVYDINVYK